MTMALEMLGYCSNFMPAYVDEIEKIRMSPRLGEDVIAWGPGRFRVFSIRSTYKLAFDETQRGNAASTSTSVSGGRSC